MLTFAELTTHWGDFDLNEPSVLQYEKALKALEEALALGKDSITRDASIQRFEFCVELAWKTSKKVLGTNTSAPKDIIREMAQSSLIDDTQSWFDYLMARHLSSHTYREELAEQVYTIAQAFLPEAVRLLAKLKAK